MKEGKSMKNFLKRCLKGVGCFFAFAVLCSVCTNLNALNANAATVKYAKEFTSLEKPTIYKVGSHRYETQYGKQSSSLSLVKGGKKTIIASAKGYTQYEVEAEYGNYLYYKAFTKAFDLYRYDFKAKKNTLIQKNVAAIRITKDKLVTQSTISKKGSSSIYISRLNGSGKRRLTQDSWIDTPEIYGNRIYYIKRKYLPSYKVSTSKYTEQVVSMDLNGRNKKTHGITIKSTSQKTPKAIQHFNKNYLVYAAFNPGAIGGVWTSNSAKYYQVNYKTKKQRRIYPTSTKLSVWADSVYH